MSELPHPPVDTGLSRANLTPERDLAERLYETLDAYGVRTISQVGDAEEEYPTTPYVELPSSIDGDGDVMVRIMGSPVMAMNEATTGHSMTRSNEYTVIQMQYGQMHFEDDVAEEDREYTPEQIVWRSYIAAIINRRDLSDLNLVDQSTGQPLDVGSIVEADFLLGMVRSELRGMEFEELELYGDGQDSEPTQEEFDPEEGYAPYYCGSCQRANVPCAHNPFTLN